MKIRILVFAVFCLIALPLPAAEYVVHLESVRNSLTANSDQPTETKSLGSIELLCRQGERTQSKVTIGKETVSLNITVRSVSDDHVTIGVDYKRSVDIGNTIRDTKGTIKNAPHETVMNCPSLS